MDFTSKVREIPAHEMVSAVSFPSFFELVGIFLTKLEVRGLSRDGQNICAEAQQSTLLNGFIGKNIKREPKRLSANRTQGPSQGYPREKEIKIHDFFIKIGKDKYQDDVITLICRIPSKKK